MDVDTDDDGRLRVVRWAGHAAPFLVATLSALAVLDAGDGKLDGIVHWCRMLGGMLHVPI